MLAFVLPILGYQVSTHWPKMVVVAALLPTIQYPEVMKDSELMQATVHVAVKEGLVAVMSKRIIVFDERRVLQGSIKEISEELQVSEVVTSHIDCGADACHISLRRYLDGELIEISDLNIPKNSYHAMQNILIEATQKLYPEGDRKWPRLRRVIPHSE